MFIYYKISGARNSINAWRMCGVISLILWTWCHSDSLEVLSFCFNPCATWKSLDNENQPDNTCCGCRYIFGEFSRIFSQSTTKQNPCASQNSIWWCKHFKFRWNFFFGRSINNLVFRVTAMNNNIEMKCEGDVFCLSRIRLNISTWFSLLRGIFFISADFGWFLYGAR